MDQKDSNQHTPVAANNEDRHLHQPSADFLKLIQILWDRKCFLLLFFAVFTIIFTFLPIHLIEPVYKTSAIFSISSLSIPGITNYHESDAFRTKLLNSTDNSKGDENPFSFFARTLYSTPEKKVGSLDIFWESSDPEKTYSNLGIATEFILKFVVDEFNPPTA